VQSACHLISDLVASWLSI